MDISFHYPPVPACSHEDGTENLIPGLTLPVPTHGKDPSSVCYWGPSLLVMILGKNPSYDPRYSGLRSPGRSRHYAELIPPPAGYG